MTKQEFDHEREVAFDKTFAEALDRGHLIVCGFNDDGEAIYGLTDEGIRYGVQILGLELPSQDDT